MVIVKGKVFHIDHPVSKIPCVTSVALYQPLVIDVATVALVKFCLLLYHIYL